ncbi:hypothetical protein HPP92_004596 [Vanilla planifolia]|nr:hypothetical protein HPP92_004596 [Vanilla planifolia]
MVSGKGLPCMDQLREELSCAICLEICYEPSTTPCGHSFCKKCLKRAAEKCGKSCPKCRQVISYRRPCSVNTVLWNTIQLLFPEEVVSRKKAAADSATSSRRGASNHGTESERSLRHMRSSYLHVSSSRSSNNSFRSAMEVFGTEESYRNSGRRHGPSQAEDAAFALRLQREEFLEAFRTSNGEQRDSAYSARARLRAMASATHRLRSRGYHA